MAKALFMSNDLLCKYLITNNLPYTQVLIDQ